VGVFPVLFFRSMVRYRTCGAPYDPQSILPLLVFRHGTLGSSLGPTDGPASTTPLGRDAQAWGTPGPLVLRDVTCHKIGAAQERKGSNNVGLRSNRNCKVQPHLAAYPLPLRSPFRPLVLPLLNPSSHSETIVRGYPNVPRRPPRELLSRSLRNRTVSILTQTRAEKGGVLVLF